MNPCDPESQADRLYCHDCNGCKETFYQIMKNRMMETYCVLRIQNMKGALEHCLLPLIVSSETVENTFLFLKP